MQYRDAYLAFTPEAGQADDREFPQLGVTLRSIDITSAARDVLPGATTYQCVTHARTFDGTQPTGEMERYLPGDESLLVPDCDIESNARYRCLLMEVVGTQPRGVILLLHGLNEKLWDKYLPLALGLAQRTGKSVLLFPIAFHMNRTPASWSDVRRMARVAAERQAQFPSIAGSSLANAAISTRLHTLPQRFFWSGFQSYEDILAILRTIRAGEFAGLSADVGIDIFAYSIGGFLSEILLMGDEEGLFTRSRLLLFCGGPTLDRMNPTSRYILDSEASIAVYAFFNQHLESEFRRDPRLAHYFGEGHAAGRAFRSMLSYHTLREEREQRFSALADRVHAIALRNDTVIPPGEVINTLQGINRDIPIPVDILDADFPCSHVNPFPHGSAHSTAVDRAYRSVMDTAAAHLSS